MSLHIYYDRNRFHLHDTIIDDNGQFYWPFATLCEYGVKRRYDWPEWITYFRLDENTLVRTQADSVKFKSDGVHFDKKYIAPFDCCVRYTGVVDINGKPIYTKDYVKIDELGWTGFVYQDRDLKGIYVEGIGGFSSNPFQIEKLGNPVLGDVSPWLEEFLEVIEKDFMIHNHIPLNTPRKFNKMEICLK